MNKTVYQGTCTAAITPFTEDGIDFTYLKKQIEFQIKNGIDALCFLGTTGESCTVSESEYDTVSKFAFDAVEGRVKFILGTGSNSTQIAEKKTKFAEKLGVDGVLVVTPYYNKCTQKGIVNYYKNVCECANTHVICYNVPQRTGVNILPETMAKIAEIKNVAGIKEASGDLIQIKKTAELIKDKCALYSGDDHLNLDLLKLGSKGIISAVSNLLPKEVGEIYRLFICGKIKSAEKLNDKLLPVIRELFVEVNPIPIKFAMNLLGLDSGILRSPLTLLEHSHQQSLIEKMKESGVIA